LQVVNAKALWKSSRRDRGIEWLASSSVTQRTPIPAVLFLLPVPPELDTAHNPARENYKTATEPSAIRRETSLQDFSRKFRIALSGSETIRNKNLVPRRS
jgi:hypothetical protein